MEKNLAEIIINATYRSIDEASQAMILVNENCTSSERNILNRGLSNFIEKLETEILVPIFEEIPELLVERNAFFKRYGKRF